VQLIIPFEFEPEFHGDDFIRCQCNVDAHRAVYNTEMWPDKRLLILGDAGSGKTHLANIWADINGAEVLNPSAEPLFARPLVIENIDQIVDESMLFHHLNTAHQKSLPILMTAQNIKKYQLPDLNSRINSCYKSIIKEPSIELLKVILLKSLCDRQLKIGNDVLEYIVVRMQRSFFYVKMLVAQLDQASAKEKRNITIPFVRKIIANVIVEQMDHDS